MHSQNDKDDFCIKCNPLEREEFEKEELNNC